MGQNESKTAIEAAADHLRAIVLARESGALIGNEEALTHALGCSRGTVRQVARLLEREGLLRVRRGVNGGYFGSRPDAGTVEANVAVFLETLDVEKEDVAVIATALWIEAVRKAAGAGAPDAAAKLEPIRKRIKAIKETATFADILQTELKYQAAIFSIANSRYIKLIFDINAAYLRKNYTGLFEEDDADFVSFISSWRDSRLMEISAILAGDQDLAAIASSYNRKVWNKRTSRRLHIKKS